MVMATRAVLFCTLLALGISVTNAVSDELCLPDGGLKRIPGTCKEFAVCVEPNFGEYVIEKNLTCSYGTAFSNERSVCLPQNEVSGCEFDDSPGIQNRDISKDGLCTKVETYCADCDQLVSCLTTGKPPTKIISCSSSGDNVCLTGRCKKRDPTLTDACNAPKTFQCSDTGFFPDPTDDKGTKYFYCIDATSPPQSRVCKTGENYDMTTAKCAATGTAGINIVAAKTDCSTDPSPAPAPLPDSSYYVSCTPLDSDPTTFVATVTKCPAGKGFDATSAECLTKCDSANPVPDPDSCTSFIECTASADGTTFTAGKSTKCAEGTAFNPDTLVCQPLANVPSCKPDAGTQTTVSTAPTTPTTASAAPTTPTTASPAPSNPTTASTVPTTPTTASPAPTGPTAASPAPTGPTAAPPAPTGPTAATPAPPGQTSATTAGPVTPAPPPTTAGTPPTTIRPPPPCTAAGKFAYPGSPTKYVQCVALASGGFTQFTKNCLPNTMFNSATGNCEAIRK